MKRLSQQQVDQFNEHGVLIADDVLTDADLAPVIAAFERWIDEAARQSQREGTVTDLHEGEPFDRRLCGLWQQDNRIVSDMDIIKSRLPDVYEFHFNEHLLDAIEDLIGPEISINPIEHVRAKLPISVTNENISFQNVPWHQDAAVTWEEADDSQIITCWIPLVDATRANGCMRVIPGMNKRGYLEHVADPQTRVSNAAFPHDTEPIVAECRKGGIVLMSRYTPHSGLVNHSNHIRWSLDLRYHPTGQLSGRPFFPTFVARSAAQPDAVERDYDDWRAQWDDALTRSTGIVWHRTTPVEKRIPADSPHASRRDRGLGIV